jgi:hypothetical protein
VEGDDFVRRSALDGTVHEALPVLAKALARADIERRGGKIELTTTATRLGLPGNLRVNESEGWWRRRPPNSNPTMSAVVRRTP